MFSWSTMVDSGILLSEFHPFEALVWRRCFWVPSRYPIICDWPWFWWWFLPSWRQSSWVDPATGLALLHIRDSRANNRHLSLFETYPTLAFRISKMIHILTFGMHSGDHLPRLVCYLDGLTIIQDCCHLGLVWFISREEYTSNLVEWFWAFECLPFLRELSQGQDYFGLVKNWQEHGETSCWVVHGSSRPSLVSTNTLILCCLNIKEFTLLSNPPRNLQDPPLSSPPPITNSTANLTICDQGWDCIAHLITNPINGDLTLPPYPHLAEVVVVVVVSLAPAPGFRCPHPIDDVAMTSRLHLHHPLEPAPHIENMREKEKGRPSLILILILLLFVADVIILIERRWMLTAPHIRLRLRHLGMVTPMGKIETKTTTNTTSNLLLCMYESGCVPHLHVLPLGWAGEERTDSQDLCLLIYLVVVAVVGVMSGEADATRSEGMIGWGLHLHRDENTNRIWEMMEGDDPGKGIMDMNKGNRRLTFSLSSKSDESFVLSLLGWATTHFSFSWCTWVPYTLLSC